jgi:tetratricopeptide (TPR) repeat protein
MPSTDAPIHRLAVVILLSSFVALTSSRGWARPAADPDAKAKASAKALAADADRHYKLGRFEEALAAFEKAYETFPAPGLLFNIAQCHRALGHWERALFFYQGYLRERPDAPNRATVETLIEQTRRSMDEERARADREAEDRRRAEERAREDARLAREAEERRRAEELERQALLDTQREGRPITKKWWFWTAVAGTALLVGGTVLYLSSDASEVPPSGSLGTLDWR